MLKTGLLLGIVFSGLSVVLGAFGAHALKDKISEYYMGVYDKGVLYQMFHSISIIVVSILNHSLEKVELDSSIYLFSIGILLFSGSLYLLAITGHKWLGAITPIGGTLFIAGWFILFIKILKLQ